MYWNYFSGNFFASSEQDLADYNIIPLKLTLRICGFNLILQKV